MKKVMTHLKNILPRGITSLFALSLLFSLFLVTDVMSQSWYIKPSSELPLRRGQGTEYKILYIVPDGTRVSIIEEEEPWVKITTEDGKEGWILKRYLSSEKPAHEVVEALQQENSSLKSKLASITGKNDETASHNDKLQQELDNCLTSLSTTRKEYQTLREDTDNVVIIKENLDKSKITISKLQKEFGKVAEENNDLKKYQNIKWFLAGGGTLIFGCIVGMMLARSRKRKSSYY